jgi:hypothetical protein
MDEPTDEKDEREQVNTSKTGTNLLNTYTSKITNVTKDKQFLSPAKGIF